MRHLLLLAICDYGFVVVGVLLIQTIGGSWHHSFLKTPKTLVHLCQRNANKITILYDENSPKGIFLIGN
jgi:hypothetical protein